MLMLSKSFTHSQQSLLAEYTRTGNETLISKLKDINSKGIRYYRELIFNIVWDSIISAYPIFSDFLGEQMMKELINDFFMKHKCQTYKVWEIPKEFKDYLIENNKAIIKKYPFLPDLLLFEWMEIELFMMEDIEFPSFDDTGNIEDKIILNPEIHILTLEYPVHKKHPREISKIDKGYFFLLLNRHPNTKKVIFYEINMLVVKILESLYFEPMSTSNLINLFIKNNLIIERNQIETFIQQSYQNGVILGFSK